MKTIYRIIPLCLLTLLTACTNSADDEYAHERAFLKFAPVTGVVPLNNAVNSMGQFCTITLGANAFQFRSGEGATATYPYTAEIKSYGQPECISGFVIGKSSLPDMNLQYPVLAYDLVCPNCYAESLITRALTLKGEELSCSRCHRVYDLTNRGIVKQGQAGKSLMRYRTCTYNPNLQGGLLVVMN